MLSSLASLISGPCVFSEVARVKKDLEAMKKQAESTNKEYDRLAEENRSLQVRNFVIIQRCHSPIRRNQEV